MCQGSIYRIRFVFVQPASALSTGTAGMLGGSRTPTGPGEGLLPGWVRLELCWITEDDLSGRSILNVKKGETLGEFAHWVTSLDWPFQAKQDRTKCRRRQV